MANSTHNNLILRDVADGDMHSIHEIYADQVLHGVSSWEEQPPSVDEMMARRDAILAAGNPYYVAVLDGAVVGYAYASPYRTRVGYRYTIENAIYVAKNTRGHGVGRCLMEALVEGCEALGYRQMMAVIGDSENHLSIGFHRQMGFTQVGHIKSIGFKFGRWMDSIVMQRPLGSGDSNLP